MIKYSQMHARYAGTPNALLASVDMEASFTVFSPVLDLIVVDKP